MRPHSGRRCSLARVVEAVGEFWALLILRNLWMFGPQRFEDLRRRLDISTNTLSDRLAGLQERGIIERRAYQDNPERFEYLLTAAGADLVPALMVLTTWGDEHVPHEDGPSMVFGHEGSDHLARPVLACGECGEELSAENVVLKPVAGAFPE